VQKLYQWICEQASFFRKEDVRPGPSRTVRTEVTVERNRAMFVLGDLTTAGMQACPLCGQSLEPEGRKKLPPISTTKETL
jgi:hypothetical protein